MDLTLISRALRGNWLIVAIGAVVAVLAGVLAGYSITSSGLEPRTPSVYRGASTIILSNPNESRYAAQLGTDVPEGSVAVQQSANLANLAIIYAWIVSGDEIRDSTAQRVGPFSETESLTAQRRTTQPTGSEEFGTNAALPIFDVVASANSGKRAEQIAAGATDVFLQYVTEQQDAAGIPSDKRVGVTVLRSATSELTEEGSSPASAAIVGLVVFFVVFLLVVYRTNAAEVRAGRRSAPATERPGSNGAAPHSDFGAWEPQPMPVPVLTGEPRHAGPLRPVSHRYSGRPPRPGAE